MRDCIDQARYRITTITLAAYLALSAVAAADDPAKHFDIPQQSLPSALTEFARQSDRQLLFSTKAVDSKQTTGVKGDLAPEAALQVLLKGTGLSFRTTADKTILVDHAGNSGANIKSLSWKDGQNALGSGHATNQLRLAQANRGAPAAASTEGKEDAEAASGDLEEIVVTAQKRQERLQDVPITISVLSGSSLDESSFSSTRDALAMVPGMATVSDILSGGTQLSLRGVSAGSADFAGSTPVAFYLDGVPLALIRSAYLPDTNIYDLQRIEVLSGPQGTLYGASALNGVVRVLTNDADLSNFDFKGRASTSNTDHGGENYDGDMAVNIPLIDGKLGMRLVAGSAQESGWIDSIIGNHVNNVETDNERLKINAEPTDTLSMGLSAWHSSREAGGPPQSDQNYYLPSPYPMPESNHFNAYSFHINNDFPGFSLTSTSSYIDYVDFGNEDFTAEQVDFGVATWSNTKIYTEEFNLLSTGSGPWKWSAGTFYRNAEDRYYETFWLHPNPPAFGDAFSDTSKSEALYGELTRKLFQDQFEISAGVRYFRDNEGTQPNLPSTFTLGGGNPGAQSATSSATTPRAILTWKPAQDFTAYFAYGQGFRSGFPQDYLVQAAYPAVKPDKLTNYELGIKGDAFQQRLSYTIATYYIDWTGVQEALSVVSNGIGLFVVANAQSASGPGAEFSITARPTSGLSLNTTFSWNDLTFDHTVYSGGVPVFLKGNRLDTSPEFTASGSVDYSFPIGPSGFQGQVSASENYTSVLNSVYILASGPSNVPSNSMLIARAQFVLKPSDHWTVALFGDNLANYNGALVAYNSAYFDKRATPRTVGLRVDYHLR